MRTRSVENAFSPPAPQTSLLGHSRLRAPVALGTPGLTELCSLLPPSSTRGSEPAAPAWERSKSAMVFTECVRTIRKWENGALGHWVRGSPGHKPDSDAPSLNTATPTDRNLLSPGPGTVARWVGLPLATLASPIQEPAPVPAALIPTPLPANVPGKHWGPCHLCGRAGGNSWLLVPGSSPAQHWQLRPSGE